MKLSREDYEFLLHILSAAADSAVEVREKKQIKRLMDAIVDDYLERPVVVN